MKYYAASRLSVFDVKWAKQYYVNESFYTYHYNPYYQLIMVSEGPVYLQVENEKFILEAGETFLLNPWERHMGWRKPEGASAFFWVQFSPDPPFKELDTSTKPISEYEILHAEKNELRTTTTSDADQLLIPRRFKPSQRFKILNHFEDLDKEMKHPVGYFRFRLTQHLCKILEIISTDLLEQNFQTITLPGSYHIYRQLLSFFHDFYQTDLTKEVIEKKMNRSYEHVSQVFKKHSGMNIVHYIHQLRIQRAKHLLVESSLSIQEIAREIGIEDPFYFSKIFKQLEGMPPSKYRENNSRQR
ncbi:AraC family transcriptional regulator [Paenibacillus radicis (ex Xue et al. 2023)]|uniref:AraC family transcriptional regulator n=1 Tax=Paenibacillus radicis (ex Xue et al. 2023) TaxID=2972489 RepID=A0ABT1YV70_9BACL|nr:AraC family transcriptional regulator [Paenibacillus radicis (ex Xue et al. 2023)]MCR8636842.1 AraC family transcriptional regulator [Paenibacillus radicis (ex Xue et al. 2023)]